MSLQSIYDLAAKLFPKVGSEGPEPVVATFARALLPATRKYVALLSQTGTNAPVATVLENNIGTIVWTRDSAGVYVATLVGAFPKGKTVIHPYPVQGEDAQGDAMDSVVVNVVSTNTFNLESRSGGNPDDDILDNTPIEILVYI